MQVEAGLRMRIVGAVEADHVVILILDPHPAQEASGSCALPGHDINNETTNFTQKLAAHKSELVIFFLKVSIKEHHLGEAERKKFQRVNTGQLVEHPVAETRSPDEGYVLRAFGHLEASEKVLVLCRDRVTIAVRLEVLQVGLYHRPHMSHLREKRMLALDDPVQHFVK